TEPALLARLVEQIGPVDLLATSLGAAAPDRAAMGVLRRQTGPPAWTVYGVIPELFSAGPLAALAGLIIAGVDHPARRAQADDLLAIGAIDCGGGATAVRVRLTGPPGTGNRVSTG